jgi:hypothetical protein
MRSYRTTRLSVGTEAVGIETEGAPEVLEKAIRLPDTGLRGFEVGALRITARPL